MVFLLQTAKLIAFCVGLLMFGRSLSLAQVDGMQRNTQYDLADSVQIDRADSTVLSHLERARAYLDDRQWDDAIETIRNVMENSGDKLFGVTDRRFISIRQYCNLKLARLPAEALSLYRMRVDPLAENWYREGVARRDPVKLLLVVDQAFASSWGDDALAALADLAIGAGHFAEARAYLEKIVPGESLAGAMVDWLAFPDTDYDLAMIRARLILVSILEGARSRAEAELTQYKKLHPGAQGRLGGQQVNYFDALSKLLVESERWETLPVSDNWDTFAGSMWREKIATKVLDVGRIAWRVALRDVVSKKESRLSFNPIVFDNLVLVNNQTEIRAIDIRTGKSAWGHDSTVVFRDKAVAKKIAGSNLSDVLGTPQFTMTVDRGRVFARMGTVVTSSPKESLFSAESSYLVCLDLRAQGRLVWRVGTQQKGWFFEGSPVVDGDNVYVAMRKSDVQPQAHVACFDALTGQRRWRRFVCSAPTPVEGSYSECTHDLLTLKNGTLYYNTNLGAVAALESGDGLIKWVFLYPRVLKGDLRKPEPQMRRELNPCLYDGGTLFVAPKDSRRIFALDADGGRLLWQTGSQARDVFHLLGVVGDKLIASGERIYWIGIGRHGGGSIKYLWPNGPRGLGFGRGVLAGGNVYWPTRRSIFVFDQLTAKMKKKIHLVPKGVTGGNLLAWKGRLILSNGSELVSFSVTGD